MFNWPKRALRPVLGDTKLPAPQKASKRAKRTCPFYKRLQGAEHITVDAFSYGTIPNCQAYFLTHGHYDHYGGLTPSFEHKVYASEITARFVVQQLKIPSKQVVALPMLTPVKVAGVTVTLLDANHCPGAVVFLFELPNGKRILHTGDFRASKALWDHPLLKDKACDVLYLDTTYCNERYALPSQDAVINYVANLVLKHVKRKPRTLVCVGSYTIGKERVFLAAARSLGAKIWANSTKRKIFALYEDESLNKLLTDDRAAQVHVVGMRDLKLENLEEIVKKPWFIKSFDNILALRPTGWTHSAKRAALTQIKPIVKGNITSYGVPYSEHSSFTELKQCVQALKPGRIIPTVNVGNAKSREVMASYFRRWQKR